MTVSLLGSRGGLEFEAHGEVAVVPDPGSPALLEGFTLRATLLEREESLGPGDLPRKLTRLPTLLRGQLVEHEERDVSHDVQPMAKIHVRRIHRAFHQAHHLYRSRQALLGTGGESADEEAEHLLEGAVRDPFVRRAGLLAGNIRVVREEEDEVRQRVLRGLGQRGPVENRGVHRGGVPLPELGGAPSQAGEDGGQSVGGGLSRDRVVTDGAQGERCGECLRQAVLGDAVLELADHLRGGLLHEQRGGDEQIRRHKRGRRPDEDEESLARGDAKVGGVRGASEPVHVVRIGRHDGPDHLHDALHVRRPHRRLRLILRPSAANRQRLQAARLHLREGADARGFRVLGQRSRQQVLNDERLDVVDVLHEE